MPSILFLITTSRVSHNNFFVCIALNSFLESLGFTGCNTWTTHTNDFYASGPFVAKANEYASFLTILSTSGLVGGRNVSLSNMWNIFDFMNVQNVSQLQLPT